jgi:1-pyrroline-5-carboxylate dehydrogenase
LLGGKHSIPKKYGAIEPTAVRLPLKAMVASDDAFSAATTEVFGPFQAVVSYSDADLPLVLECLERMSHHLTAAVVSNDAMFLQKVLAHSVNGTTYAGARARTTGAPQNHWFGPAGDPRGAGIGTPEAIRLVWSCHREIIYDMGPAQPDEEAARLPVT